MIRQAEKNAHEWLNNFVEAHLNRLVWTHANSCFSPSGWNGPHQALETPVRNSAHWLIALIEYALRGGEVNVEKYINGIATWLLECNPFYVNGQFIARIQGNLDSVNGVIGPAWIIEALNRYHRYTQDARARTLLDDILSKTIQDKATGFWKRFDNARNRFDIDLTLDHQIWMASVLLECGREQEVEIFLNSIEIGSMRLREDGRISHLGYVRTFKGILAQARFKFREKSEPARIQDIEDAYQTYVLYPMARIHLTNRKLAVYNEKIAKAIKYVTPALLSKLEDNPLGFGYNSPAFELPMIALAYGEYNGDLAACLKSATHIQEKFMNAFKSASINSRDPITLTARIYELAIFLEAVRLDKTVRN